MVNIADVAKATAIKATAILFMTGSLQEWLSSRPNITTMLP
jgi:hypothetical protein